MRNGILTFLPVEARVQGPLSGELGTLLVRRGRGAAVHGFSLGPTPRARYCGVGIARIKEQRPRSPVVHHGDLRPSALVTFGRRPHI